MATWLFGYAVTYLVVAPDVRESRLHRIVAVLEGAPATYEMVGWVFYNAHFVRVVFRNLPLLGSFTTNFVVADDGFAVALHAIPVALLFAAGAILAWHRRAIEPTEGMIAGTAAIPGYLVPSIAGTFAFEVTIGTASAAPDLLPAIVLSGAAYPAFFAACGGAAWTIVSRRSRSGNRSHGGSTTGRNGGDRG